MFDKLIVTEPEGADFRNRRNYFMVSSVVVGILFATAVVISIYAADLSLGRDSFELATIVAPPEIEQTEPKPRRLQTASNSPKANNILPSKPSYVAPIDKPNSIPKDISTAPSVLTTWNSTNPASPGTDIPDGIGRNVAGTDTSSPGITGQSEPIKSDPIPDPPPVIKKPVEAKPPPIVSEGVINGKAIYLPKPAYPAVAIATNARGAVNVQVLIDEKGSVISARAISGNKLLRDAAERSARQAQFSPTYLSKVPVKVTGVIVYNFVR